MGKKLNGHLMGEVAIGMCMSSRCLKSSSWWLTHPCSDLTRFDVHIEKRNSFVRTLIMNRKLCHVKTMKLYLSR